MRLVRFVLTGALLMAPGVVFAQPPQCTPGVQSVQEAVTVQRPQGFSASATARFVPAEGPAPAGAALGNPGDTWNADQVKRLSTIATGNPLDAIVWSEGGRECFQRLNLVAAGQQPATTAGGQARRAEAFDEGDCAASGADWRRELVPRGGPQRSVSVLVFNTDGQLCHPPPARPTQGDPIYVGVFTNDPQWSRARITFEPCSLEPSAPNVLVTGRLPDITALQAEEPFRLYKFPVRQCWDSTVAINVTGAGDRQLSYSLAQATRYRATLHLGTVFTDDHDQTFGLRPGEGGQRIFAQGPAETGPEYVAAVVFYSIFRYLPSLAGGPQYPGRDPVADTGIADRIGGVMGVGLRHPTRRFIAGFSFEVAAGVNVLGVWDWSQTRQLRDVAEGDVFGGTADQIPVRREWDRQFVFGISMDLVYAANAFTR